MTSHTHETIRSRDPRREHIRKTTRQVLASAGVAIAFLGIIELDKKPPNPQLAQLRTELVQRAIKTSNPNIIIEPYKVGLRPWDVMLSQVASDLHPLTPGEDAVGEMQTLATYLNPGQDEFEAFDHGQQLKIGIDISKGIIIPKAAIPDSAGEKG